MIKQIEEIKNELTDLTLNYYKYNFLYSVSEFTPIKSNCLRESPIVCKYIQYFDSFIKQHELNTPQMFESNKNDYDKAYKFYFFTSNLLKKDLKEIAGDDYKLYWDDNYNFDKEAKDNLIEEVKLDIEKIDKKIKEVKDLDIKHEIFNGKHRLVGLKLTYEDLLNQLLAYSHSN